MEDIGIDSQFLMRFECNSFLYKFLDQEDSSLPAVFTTLACPSGKSKKKKKKEKEDENDFDVKKEKDKREK